MAQLNTKCFTNLHKKAIKEKTKTTSVKTILNLTPKRNKSTLICCKVFYRTIINFDEWLASLETTFIT